MEPAVFRIGISIIMQNASFSTVNSSSALDVQNSGRLDRFLTFSPSCAFRRFSGMPARLVSVNDRKVDRFGCALIPGCRLLRNTSRWMILTALLY
ncbi:hypothetical protein M404DRAFT_781242 [Pisolithus tinctorius Marx 270]|uniref:Uncharacterized protein n=1 Tax=Pisolithus tinctorius Marx 270 TaxID=870435 RepID=A0A0C3JQC3_PISTI|nr:hypothetical protein M404DRAFT_781242 [Pisolithus tinctorius Marx 270]